MKFIELIETRYSLRKYSQKPVPREAIERCMNAARLAPSACNSQPWRFIIVDREPARTQLVKEAFSGINSMNSFVASAPVIIVVETLRSSYLARLGGFFKGTQFSLIDIGIACDHLTLQAAEEGIGTCWLGMFNEKGVKQALVLPFDAKIDILISMGYPEEGSSSPAKNRQTLDEIRTYYAGE